MAAPFRARDVETAPRVATHFSRRRPRSPPDGLSTERDSRAAPRFSLSRKRPTSERSSSREPSMASRPWHRRDDSRARRSDRPPPEAARSPIGFGDRRRQLYRGRHVIERCFTSSRSGAASRCAQTNSPATVTQDSASAQPLTGSPARRALRTPGTHALERVAWSRPGS